MNKSLGAVLKRWFVTPLLPEGRAGRSTESAGDKEQHLVVANAGGFLAVADVLFVIANVPASLQLFLLSPLPPGMGHRERRELLPRRLQGGQKSDKNCPG